MEAGIPAEHSHHYRKVLQVTFSNSKAAPSNSPNLLNIHNYANIFHLILSILCAVSKNQELINAANQYAKIDLKTTSTKDQHSTYSSNPPKLSKLTISSLTLSCAALIFIALHHMDFFNNVNIYNIQPPPEKGILLPRKDITNKITSLFFKHSDTSRNPIVVLSGMGGAGKTTLTRQWAQGNAQQTITWEINSETPETILNSFQNLSLELARSDHESLNSHKLKALLILLKKHNDG